MEKCFLETVHKSSYKPKSLIGAANTMVTKRTANLKPQDTENISASICILVASQPTLLVYSFLQSTFF